MITVFRRYLETWVVRGFFILMAVSLGAWGISADVARLLGASTWVAKIGDQTIEAQAFQVEFQRAMGLATRDLPAGQEATGALRKKIGEETLQRMVSQAALSQELRTMRIVTPDSAVAEMARTMPAFRGADGKFSKTVFDAVLRNNGLNEARYLDLLRADLAGRQLLGAISAGAGASESIVGPLYAANAEKRSADMVHFLFSAVPEPAEPDEAVLRRWYENHPDTYSTPEYRRIKAIELSPRTLAGELPVTDDDIKAAYDRRKAEFTTASLRSAQVISAPDESKAKALSERWRAGADWAAMQAAATEAGASAIALDDAPEAQFPDPDLSKAVFAAELDKPSEPVKAALGWFVVTVTKATQGGTSSLEEVKDTLRAKVLADKAADLMYDRANKVDNLLANGTALDEMPGDLNLAGIAGTLDDKGMTQDGTPAPIPGAPELRTALIAGAFQTQKGDPPRLVEVQTPSSGGSAYFALVVEDVTPPGPRPFEEVRQRVWDDWSFDQQHRTQDSAASAMLTALKSGQSFTDAATVAGVEPRLTPIVGRGAVVDGMPPELQRVLFDLKPGEPTMVETAEGFIVAIPGEIIVADPKADQAGYDQARVAIARSIGNDLVTAFADALRTRANPRLNQKNIDSVVQP